MSLFEFGFDIGIFNPLGFVGDTFVVQKETSLRSVSCDEGDGRSGGRYSSMGLVTTSCTEPSTGGHRG